MRDEADLAMKWYVEEDNVGILIQRHYLQRIMPETHQHVQTIPSVVIAACVLSMEMSEKEQKRSNIATPSTFRFSGTLGRTLLLEF